MELYILILLIKFKIKRIIIKIKIDTNIGIPKFIIKLLYCVKLIIDKTKNKNGIKQKNKISFLYFFIISFNCKPNSYLSLL